MRYTREQLENMSIEELRRIDNQLSQQIKPGDSIKDIDPG